MAKMITQMDLLIKHFMGLSPKMANVIVLLGNRAYEEDVDSLEEEIYFFQIKLRVTYQPIKHKVGIMVEIIEIKIGGTRIEIGKKIGKIMIVILIEGIRIVIMIDMSYIMIYKFQKIPPPYIWKTTKGRCAC